MKATENPMKETNKLKESRDFWMQLAKIQAETMRIMTDYLAEMNKATKAKSYKVSDEAIEEKKEPNIALFSLPKSIIELGGIKFHNYYIEHNNNNNTTMEAKDRIEVEMEVRKTAIYIARLYGRMGAELFDSLFVNNT